MESNWTRRLLAHCGFLLREDGVVIGAFQATGEAVGVLHDVLRKDRNAVHVVLFAHWSMLDSRKDAQMTFSIRGALFVWLQIEYPPPPPPRLAVHPKLFNQDRERGTEMQESYRDQVVRKEKGLVFQYPERITLRALEGRCPQSFWGIMKGVGVGGERDVRQQPYESDASRVQKNGVMDSLGL